ncbi:MAG: hypothetical protein H0T46_32310 [Deltaproteobacteria bacterium]|nr:hypothetical protein [Deltaproteobacteria bacterium]
MSTPKTESTEAFVSVDPEQLATVAGGASRVSGKSGGDAELTAMLTQIGDSIKDLASAKNNNSGGDTMQLMMMMLMMGGGGGGGGYAAPSAVAPPVINLDTAVAGGGGCRRKGKKGW